MRTNYKFRSNVLKLLSIILILSSCKTNEYKSELQEITGRTMGTTYSIKFVVEEQFGGPELDLIKTSVDSVLEEVNRQMSTYLDTSEISRFNTYEGDEWYPVSKDFALVVDESKKIGKLTNGALDITVGPLVNLWGFGPENRPRKIPSNSEIIDAKEFIGLDKLLVNLNPPSLKKLSSKLYIDLSATAKGFGVDKVFDLLSEKGFNNFFVEIGGEVRAAGSNHKSEYWKIGVANPNNPANPQIAVSVDNAAVATSGDYWNYFEEDGKRYSHTIDPRTGKPILHNLASVTVISSHCLKADALATALNVMGPDEGFKFAVRNKIAAYFIVRSGEKFRVETTSQFEKYLEK